MQYANDKDTTIIGLVQTAGESRFFRCIYVGFLIAVHIPVSGRCRRFAFRLVVDNTFYRFVPTLEDERTSSYSATVQ